MGLHVPAAAAAARPDQRDAVIRLRLLLHEAVAALKMASLDPAVGFLHQARWGRPNLALDLIEKFRALIVDAVVLRCAATGMVQPETLPEQGCRMNAKARHAFLAAYQRRMLTLFTHDQTRRRVSYRVGLGLQAKALGRAVLNPDTPYRTVRWK